jgi:hypothetical protein
MLQQVTSRQVWMVKGQGPCGVILDKPFTAELVMFGGAVGMEIDRHCQAVIPIGEVDLVQPSSFLEVQWAYRRRSYWNDWQQSITEAYPAVRRGILLLCRLQDLLATEVVDALPDPLLGKLVGLPAAVVGTARSALRHLPHQQLALGEDSQQEPSVGVPAQATGIG